MNEISRTKLENKLKEKLALLDSIESSMAELKSLDDKLWKVKKKSCKYILLSLLCMVISALSATGILFAIFLNTEMSDKAMNIVMIVVLSVCSAPAIILLIVALVIILLHSDEFKKLEKLKKDRKK